MRPQGKRALIKRQRKISEPETDQGLPSLPGFAILRETSA